MNTTTITGNLVRDPELRFTSSDQAVANFAIADNRRWQDRSTQEWQESTTFVDVAAWGDLGEHVAESLAKGDRVRHQPVQRHPAPCTCWFSTHSGKKSPADGSVSVSTARARPAGRPRARNQFDARAAIDQLRRCGVPGCRDRRLPHPPLHARPE